MRLIDADEVLKHIDAYWGTCQRIRKPRNGETAVMLDTYANGAMQTLNDS